jgi:hypothetical protein
VFFWRGGGFIAGGFEEVGGRQRTGGGLAVRRGGHGRQAGQKGAEQRPARRKPRKTCG